MLCLALVLILASCTKEPDSSSSGSTEHEVSSAPRPVNVAVSFERPDGAFSEYGGYTVENEYAVPVFFSTETGAKDFAILSLSDAQIDDDGHLSYDTITQVYSVSELGKMQYVQADIVFMGTIPNNGFCYTDSDGTIKMFTVETSGYDGSLFISELEE